jgi:adenylylsulfate kinase
MVQRFSGLQREEDQRDDFDEGALWRARGFVVWLTGPPCSGKTTLAQELKAELPRRGLIAEILDGDEFRATFSTDLGFTRTDRDANVRRIGYVARLLSRNGVVALVAAVSPYRAARAEVRTGCENDGTPFLELHVAAEREVLIARDVKGMYKRALTGDIPNFTGVSAPYEPPLAPDLVIRTDAEPPSASCRRVLEELSRRGLLGSRRFRR